MPRLNKAHQIDRSRSPLHLALEYVLIDDQRLAIIASLNAKQKEQKGPVDVFHLHGLFLQHLAFIDWFRES